MGKQSRTQTTTTEPWRPQRPFLTAGFDAASSEILSRPWQGMPGLDALQNNAIDRAAAIARRGSPAIQAAQEQNAATIRGQYLNANPYLEGAIDAASRPVVANFQRAVQPGIASGFAQAGRFGGGAHQNAMTSAQEALARQLGDISTGMSYDNYARERQNQLAAAAQAGDIFAQQFMAPQVLARMGALRDNRRMAQVDYNNRAPIERISGYQNIIGGNYGGTSSSPMYRNVGAGALGGAMTGAQLGSMFGPWGAALGTLGGGLLGGFG